MKNIFLHFAEVFLDSSVCSVSSNVPQRTVEGRSLSHEWKAPLYSLLPAIFPGINNIGAIMGVTGRMTSFLLLLLLITRQLSIAQLYDGTDIQLDDVFDDQAELERRQSDEVTHINLEEIFEEHPVLERRDAAAQAVASTPQLAQLQVLFTDYFQKMTTYLQQNAGSPAVAQLNSIFTQFQTNADAWLKQNMGGSK